MMKIVSATILHVIAGVVSGAPSASPVLSAVSDTARFSWEIPQGGLGTGSSFLAVSPANVTVFIVTATGAFINFTDRVVYQGDIAARNVTFTLSNIQTSDAGTYTCATGTVIQNCGQKLVVLGKPTTPGRPTSTTPVYNQQVTLTCSSTSTTVPADHGLTLTYTWQRDNTDITVTSPGSPYIFTVSSRDSHSYRCRARESQGLESEWSQVYNMEPQYGPYQISLTPSTSSYTVTEHQALPSITCSALCRPGCSYRWLHDGTAVSSGAMLQGQADRSKTGSYRCQPSNTHGSGDSVTVSVDVQYPAEVVLETQGSATCRPHRVYVGQQNVQLTCPVTAANPTVMSYTWTHNSSVIQSVRDAVFTISSVSRTSGGSYTCQGNNSLGGSTSSPVTLEVQYGPSVSVAASTQTVTEGQTLAVTCSVDSKPAATVTWTRKDGSSFTPQTGSTLTISNIQRSQAGTYVCTATNTLSPCVGTSVVRSDSVEMTVDVQYPAEVVLETQGSATCRPHRVYVGQQNVQLTCRVTAANPAVTSYTWTHNSSVIQSVRGAVCTISSVSRTSGGSYTCQGSNSLGGSTSSPVTLEVQYGPFVSVAASTQTVTEGQTLTVTCSVDSKPAAVVRWTRKDGSSFTPQTGSTLTISNIQRSQAGTYVCTATNTLSPCGGTSVVRSDSVEVTVDVQYPATVSMFTANSGSGSLTVNESDPVTLRCQVDSNPRSVIMLLNGTEELTRADNSLTSEYRLESADCRQRGNYSCTATNNIGAPVSQRVELLVKCSPRQDETVAQQLKYSATLGGNVNVFVSVLAFPIPTFTWSRTTSTSQDLTGSSSHVSDISVTARLHLTNLQQQDFGDYSLTVDNGVGNSVAYTVKIVSEGFPDTPTQFKDLHNSTETSIWLSWQPEFNGGYAQKFVVEYRQFATRTWTVYNTYDDTDKVMVVEVDGLAPGDIYVFRLHATNDVLNSTMVTYSMVEAKTAGEPTNPQQLEVTCTGLITGATVGAIAVILLIEGLIAVLLFRQGFRCRTAQRGTASREGAGNHETEEMDNLGYSSLDQINSPAQYSSLKQEESLKQPYSQLKIYENVKGDVETVSDTPPVSYEGITSSPYVNSGTQHQDPAYESA